MDFYTVVLRESGPYWVALCLENGIVGQGSSREEAVSNLKDAIGSFQDVRGASTDIYSAPVSINELHEFLTLEGNEPTQDRYELRAVNA